MKITKYGHCCLLIEESGLKFLTDPGAYSTLPNEITGLHAVLITHDHADHLHVDSLKAVLKNNPKAKIITNTGTAPAVQAAGFTPVILDDGGSLKEGTVLLEALGKTHAVIYHGMPPMPNTGFFIATRLFYPGDAFTDPKKPVEILALPAAGPWMKISEAVDYALKLKPKKCFPVHDGILKVPGMMDKVYQRFLDPQGIKFERLEDGKTGEY